MKDIDKITRVEVQQQADDLELSAMIRAGRDAIVPWLMQRFKPESFVTLTFDTEWHKAGRRQPAAGSWADSTHTEWKVSSWAAFGWVKRWIDYVNLIVDGQNYKRRWKHSYFGYVLAKEYQTRGIEHYHLLIDNYIPFAAAREYWWKNCGICKIEKVDDLEGSLRYTLKYCLKSGAEPVIWMPKKRWSWADYDINRAYKASMDDLQQPPEKFA